MTNPKTKMNEEAQQLLTEFTNILVLEAVKRTIKQAISSDLKLVDIEHIEKILPQLVILLKYINE